MKRITRDWPAKCGDCGWTGTVEGYGKHEDVCPSRDVPVQTPRWTEADARAIACLPELVEAARYCLKDADYSAVKRQGVRVHNFTVSGYGIENLRRILARIDGEG